MTEEETVTIRVNKKLVDRIRKEKPDWLNVNATLIVDILLRQKLCELVPETLEVK